MNTIARLNVITALGKITAFYEPLEYPYKNPPPVKAPGAQAAYPPSGSGAAKGAKRNTDPFTSREDWEKRLTRKVGAAFKDALKQLMDYLGDPPDASQVPESFWEGEGWGLRDILEEALADIALEQADRYLTVAPIGGVDWMLVHSRAVEWARTYSYELVKEINTVSREALQKEIARFFEDGNLTIEDIARDLEYYFGPKRAEMIAVTETTRAAVQGTLEIAAEIEGYGIILQAIWQTANDDIVCEVCGPRNGQPIEGNDYPPAHPNCRCWITHEVVE